MLLKNDVKILPEYKSVAKVDIPAINPLTQASTSILFSLFFSWLILICLSSKFIFRALSIAERKKNNYGVLQFQNKIVFCICIQKFLNFSLIFDCKLRSRNPKRSFVIVIKLVVKKVAKLHVFVK